MTKQLRPGGRLKEAALAHHFRVSRPRVRGVLQRLAELGFVEFRLNFGALVRRPTPEEARAVFATRRLLEAEAVRATARRATAKDFERLRLFVRNEKQAFQKRDVTVAMLSSRFHILVGEMCGNQVLAQVLNQLVHRCVLIQSLYERASQHTVCLVHEHIAVIDLMQRGRIQEAVRAMLEHLDHVEAALDYDVGRHIDERVAFAIG